MKRFISIVAILSFAVTPLWAGETIRNEVFGFEVTLPDDWVKTTADSYFENIAKVEFDDPSFQEALLKNANAPLVMATKHPEPFDDINPSFKLNARPYGGIASRDGTEILNLLLPSFENAFSGMMVTTPAHEVDIDGKKAAHIAFAYTLKVDGREFPTASELWLLPEPNYLYLIGIGYRQDEGTGSRAESVSIIDSIKFAKTAE